MNASEINVETLSNNVNEIKKENNRTHHFLYKQ